MSYPKQIQLLINEIVDEIKLTLDPDFILLAGSFGKAAWLYHDEDLISDFEFVFVKSRKWSILKKRKLQKNLNLKYPHEISLKGYLLDNVEKKVISNYAKSYRGYLSLDFFDTFSDATILYSKSGNPINVQCKPDELPVWEAWRLLINRIGDLLDIDTKQTYGLEKKYYELKFLESCADAYLIVHNLYHKSINERLKVFNERLLKDDNQLPKICKDSYNNIRLALLARKDHSLQGFDSKLSNALVSAWLNYIQLKLTSVENLSTTKGFYLAYLKSCELQSKYHGTTKNVSNFIALMYNPKLIIKGIRFYNQSISWRHMALLSVSALFQEQYEKSTTYEITRKILKTYVSGSKINALDNNKMIPFTINYWKRLR